MFWKKNKLDVAKEFAKFLGLLSIDSKKYKDLEINCKNGDKYPLNKITDARIKEFDWAYTLAEHNELVVFDYREDTGDIVEKLCKFGISCRFLWQCALENKSELLRLKDIGYFLANTAKPFNTDVSTELIYIDNKNSDIFILAKIKNKEDTSWDAIFEELEKTASKLGIDCFVRYKFAEWYWKSGNDTLVYNIIKSKNMFYEQRNAKELKIINDKLRLQAEKIANTKIPEKDEQKITEKANKVFDEIKHLGLDSICEEQPQIKDILINAFKIVLYKKWATVKELTEPDGVEGYLFHLFEDDILDEAPTVAELVFLIKDRVDEYRS